MNSTKYRVISTSKRQINGKPATMQIVATVFVRGKKKTFTRHVRLNGRGEYQGMPPGNYNRFTVVPIRYSAKFFVV